MIEYIKSCQTEEKGKIKNICPFCNNTLKLFGPSLECKLGADLKLSSTIVLDFIPDDCPLIGEITFKALKNKS